MKKKLHLQLLILSLFSVSVSAAESVLLDFESGTVPATVGAWLNYSGSGLSASTWSVANPKMDEINSTANCYKINKATTDPYWTGLEVNLMTAIPITTSNQYLHVLVYKNTTSRIALTYTPQGGSQSGDNWQTNITTGAWIDYVLPIPVGTNLKLFAIKIGDDAGEYYFDQIVLSDNPASLTRTPITIDPELKRQVIEGWGGSLCWWANIMGGYSESKVKSICDWLTDPVNGLNMNIFRFNIGGGDDPTHNHMRTDGGDMPGYKASATAEYDWTQDANQRKILQQLIASRIAKFGTNDIQIVGFSNSPPYWMTRSGCSAGSTEGNVTNLRSDMFDDFADYLTEVAKHYHDNLGITFNYIDPFNEPDGNWWKANENQEGCYFSTNDQMVMIRELYAKLSDKNMLSYCKITANDANNMDNGLNALNAYKSAGDILSKIEVAAVHSYSGSNRAGLANWAKTNNKRLWQSESGPLNVGGTNEYLYMTMSDRIISDLRDMQCSAWIDWQLAADASPAWGLIVGAYNDGFNPITRAITYYIRAQFSRYLKPGYTVINNSAYNAISAISPDEKELVIVISNKETTTQKYTFDLSKFNNLGRSQQIRTRANESLSVKNSLTFFNISGSTFTYDALPESVTTFVVPINQAPASINDARADIGNMYYSEGVLHTNFSQSEAINVSIVNSVGQLIKTYRQVSSKGTLGLNLKSGFYILTTRINNKLVTNKIHVF
jgi:hypothetical protein